MSGSNNEAIEEDQSGNLAAYLKGSLSPAESAAFERWLENQPGEKAKLEAWQRLQVCISNQPHRQPKVMILARIHARIAVVPSIPAWLSWAMRAAIGIALALILWSTIQPGVVLRWKANDNAWSSFLVLRAPAGSSNYSPVGWLPVEKNARDYTFVDTRLLPGQSFDYKVEGVDSAGDILFSSQITASYWQSLPALLTIILSSLAGAWWIVVLLRFPQARQAQKIRI
jgi:hypothetical protein